MSAGTVRFIAGVLLAGVAAGVIIGLLTAATSWLVSEIGPVATGIIVPVILMAGLLHLFRYADRLEREDAAAEQSAFQAAIDRAYEQHFEWSDHFKDRWNRSGRK